MVKETVTITIASLMMLGAFPASLPAATVRMEEVMRSPTVVYQTRFEVDASPELWDRVLDNIYLMGRLWGIYRFQPAYQVTLGDAGLHVVDPTGIVGDVRQVDRAALTRRFSGRAQFNHWAVPSFFTADGVIVFACRAEGKGLLGEMKIFMKGNNWISRAAMTLFSGILARRIDNRFASNMGDTKKIIRDLSDEPDKVRKELTGPLRDDFDRAFPGGEIKPVRE